MVPTPARGRGRRVLVPPHLAPARRLRANHRPHACRRPDRGAAADAPSARPHTLRAVAVGRRARTGREEEELAGGLPRHLVDLELELDVLQRLALAHLDQRDVVLLVADGDVLPVGAPPDVDVLPPRLDRLRALAHARVPDPDGLVAGRRPQHVRLDRVPSQLVDRVLMTLELGVDRAAGVVERPHAHALVDGAGGQLTPRAVPRDRVHLLLVARIFPGGRREREGRVRAARARRGAARAVGRCVRRASARAQAARSVDRAGLSLTGSRSSSAGG